MRQAVRDDIVFVLDKTDAVYSSHTDAFSSSHYLAGGSGESGNVRSVRWLDPENDPIRLVGRHI